MAHGRFTTQWQLQLLAFLHTGARRARRAVQHLSPLAVTGTVMRQCLHIHKQCNDRLSPACCLCSSACHQTMHCPATACLAAQRSLLYRVDRTKTPWVIVGEHAPWYHSYTTHWCAPCRSGRLDCMTYLQAAFRCMLSTVVLLVRAQQAGVFQITRKHVGVGASALVH